MKIFSVRFYKHGIVVNEILAENPDKELKRKVKVPKKYSKKVDIAEALAVHELQRPGGCHRSGLL